MNHNGNNIEARLWEAADELRANSKLKSSENSVPLLGLVFLRYADHKFQMAVKELEGKGSGRRKIGPADYQAKGVLYLRESAKFSTLIKLPEAKHHLIRGRRRFKRSAMILRTCGVYWATPALSPFT